MLMPSIEYLSGAQQPAIKQYDNPFNSSRGGRGLCGEKDPAEMAGVIGGILGSCLYCHRAAIGLPDGIGAL